MLIFYIKKQIREAKWLLLFFVTPLVTLIPNLAFFLSNAHGFSTALFKSFVLCFYIIMD